MTIMKRFPGFLLTGIIAAIILSCNIDEEITASQPPNIVLDSESGIYTVKQGREITIAPTYEQADNATYRWTMDGEVIGTAPSLSFSSNELGEYYISINIVTDGGSDEEEIRIDVVELEIPTVSIAGNRHQTVTTGTTIDLVASMRETSLPTSLAWSVNGALAGNGGSYTFMADSIGEYTITATAKNEDGVHSDSIGIKVVDAGDMPFVWEFDRTKFHTVIGRKLPIRPSSVSNTELKTNRSLSFHSVLASG
jgi:hypothetical protein